MHKNTTRWIAGCAMITIATAVVAGNVVGGVVAVGEQSCKKSDRIVIATQQGFVIATQYSGTYDKDDEVYGELNSYGSKDVLINGRAGRLYIDDYGLSRDNAAEKCFRE